MAFPFRQAWAMVYGDPRLRPIALRPLWQAAIIMVAVWIIAICGLGAWLGGLLGGVLAWVGINPDQSVLLARILIGAALIFAAQALFVGIASAMGGFVFERLSRETERIAFGTAPDLPVLKSRQWTETLIRLCVAGLVGVITLMTGWIFFGVIAALVIGSQALVDLTAIPLARRGVFLPQQVGHAWRLKGSKRFVILAGAMSLVPLLNLIALPVLVATATLMVASHEGQTLQVVESSV